MTSGHYMNFISLQYGTSVLVVEIVKLVKPRVCTVFNLYTPTLCAVGLSLLDVMGFSCFELFKLPNSALPFVNVGVSARSVSSTTIFIPHSAEVAKTQHQNFANFGISIQRDILIINN